MGSLELALLLGDCKVDLCGAAAMMAGSAIEHGLALFSLGEYDDQEGLSPHHSHDAS